MRALRCWGKAWLTTVCIIFTLVDQLRIMERTRNKACQRSSDYLGVSGFRNTDTYEETLRKAASFVKTDSPLGTLVISMGRVANCPLQNGQPWTLGGYLSELEGSKRVAIGYYLPVSMCVHDKEIANIRHTFIYANQILNNATPDIYAYTDVCYCPNPF